MNANHTHLQPGRAAAADGGSEAAAQVERYERELAGIAEQYRALFLANPEAMWIYDPETLRFVEVNHAAVELYGYSRDEFIAMTLLDIRPQSDWAALKERARLRFGNRRVTPHLWRHLKKDGSLMDVETVASDIVHQGRTARLVQIRDVTERTRLLRALHDAEREIRTIVDNAPYLFSRFDRELRYLYTSPYTTSITGRHPSAIIGKTHVEIGHAPEFCELVEREFGAVFASAKARTFEFSFATPTGRRHFFTQAIPETGIDGRIDTIVTITQDITTRKSAEDALQESNARFRALTELSSDWYWEQDENLRITQVSEGLYAHTGLGPERVLGHTRRETMGEEAYRKFSHIEEVFLRREPFRDLTFEWRDVAGRNHVFCISGAPIRDADGRFRGYRGVGRDITEQERLRQSLLESEARTRLATEFGDIGIWERELSSDCLHWSPNIGAMLGMGEVREISAEEFKTRIVHPDDLPAMLRARESWLNEREPAGVEHRVIGPDGSVRWVYQRGSVVRGSDGKPKFTLGIIQNITERKRIEAALRESGEMFRQLAENIPEVFWIGDPAKDRVLYVSPTFERLWGAPREAIYEDAQFWKRQILPEDMPKVNEFLDRQARGLPSQVEFRLRRPDATIRWLWAESFPFVGPAGERLVSGIITDVTERMEREESRIRQAHDQRDALVREVHHRIKNGLQGVVGLLRKGAADHPPLKVFMDQAIARVQSIAVVHGLQGERSGSSVALCEIMEAVGRMVESLTNVRVKLSGIVEAGRAYRVADGEMVATALVLNELIMNACKHGTPLQSQPEIDVALSACEKGARIDICNTGRLPAGFDFSKGLGCGTGLGLVRALLPAQGAKIEFTQRNAIVNILLTFEHPVIVRAPC